MAAVRVRLACDEQSCSRRQETFAADALDWICMAWFVTSCCTHSLLPSHTSERGRDVA